MFINFGERTERYELHHIDEKYNFETHGLMWSLTINNGTFFNESYDKVKTVYEDIVDALNAKTIVYTFNLCETGNPIDIKYKEIMGRARFQIGNAEIKFVERKI